MQQVSVNYTDSNPLSCTAESGQRPISWEVRVRCESIETPGVFSEIRSEAPSNLICHRQEVIPNAVPTWRKFVGEIVRTCT